MKKLIISLLTLAAAQTMSADEGMWTLYNLPQAVYETMKTEGYQLPYEKLYQADDAIMKSVVNFSGYCSGVVVSPDGLVFTNHHCGFEAIRSHSTVEHDYMLNGFYAKTFEEELPNKDMFVSFMVEQKDVTDQLLEQGHPQEAKRWLDKVVDGQRKEYQQRLDEKRGALYRTSGSPYSHPVYWGMLVVLAGLLAGVLIYERKERQVKDLHSSVQNQSEEISLLTDQIHHLRNTTNEQLGRGRQWMERLEQGEPLKNISIEDEQCFVDYYAFVHPKEFQRIIRPFRSLSLRHTTYLILSEMGYSDKDISEMGYTDKDIQRILLVKSSTIRNYRLRMNRNRRV